MQDSAETHADGRQPGRPTRPFVDARDVLPLLVIFAAGAALFVVARQRTLEPIIDSGRDLYIPGAILAGKKLYRDLLYYYPPLVPYLLSALTAVVGSSLTSYAVIGASTAAVTALTLYEAAKLMAGRLAAFVAAALFVTLNFTCAIGYGSNFLFPYAHEATFGMTFLLLTLLFLLRYLFDGARAADAALAIVFAVLASWCKIELAVIVAVAICAAAAVHRFPKRYIGAYFATMALLMATCEVFFRDAPPGHHWLFDNVFPPTFVGGSTFYNFYANVFGVPRWKPLLLASLFGALVLCAFAAGLALLQRRRHPAIVCATLLLLTLLIAAGGDSHFFQAWTLLQLVLIIPAVRDPRGRLAVLLFFSLASSLRIFLKLAPAWYGFVLTVPTYLLIVYVLFEYLPRRRLYGPRLSALWVAFVLLVIVRGVTQQVAIYTAKSAPVATTRGTFYDEPARAAVFAPLIAAVGASGAQSLVVMPEGLALNYLTGVDTPLSFYTFTPIESAHPVIETRILDELASRRPALVAIVSRHVEEFGYRGFGVDYDLRVAALIRQHYRRIGAWRAGPNWAMLLRRRD